MLPFAHIAAAYLLWRFLGLFFPADTASLLLAVFFGVFLDGDVIFKPSEHRASPFHSLVPWIMFIVLLYCIGFKYWWTALFGLLHLSLDMIDWSIYIFYPLTRRTIGLRLYERVSNLTVGENSLGEFLLEYMKNRYFMSAEIALSILAIIVSIFF